MDERNFRKRSKSERHSGNIELENLCKNAV
jgi:hypothetical protein